MESGGPTEEAARVSKRPPRGRAVCRRARSCKAAESKGPKPQGGFLKEKEKGAKGACGGFTCTLYATEPPSASPGRNRQ